MWQWHFLWGRLYQKPARFHMSRISLQTCASLRCLWTLWLHGQKYRINHFLAMIKWVCATFELCSLWVQKIVTIIDRACYKVATEKEGKKNQEHCLSFMLKCEGWVRNRFWAASTKQELLRYFAYFTHCVSALFSSQNNTKPLNHLNGSSTIKRVGGLIPGSSSKHVELSMGKIPSLKLPQTAALVHIHDYLRD